MKIAIYGTSFGSDFKKYAEQFFSILDKNKTEITVYKPFYDFLETEAGIKVPGKSTFSKDSLLNKNIDLMFSIGGDGTFLEAMYFVYGPGIPIVGINSGHLGFLANISKENIPSAMNSIFQGNYTFESRALLDVKSEQDNFGEFNFALNELTVFKKDTYTMIKVHTFINEEFLNSYWADGLIISTPTGSTAYALSVGGPIVMPGSDNFIIAPIAPHSLTVRPLVVADDNVITLVVETRGGQYMASLDHRATAIDQKVKLVIRKADNCIKMVRLPENNFFSTLRNKLMWGIDKRN